MRALVSWRCFDAEVLQRSVALAAQLRRVDLIDADGGETSGDQFPHPETVLVTCLSDHVPDWNNGQDINVR